MKEALPAVEDEFHTMRHANKISSVKTVATAAEHSWLFIERLVEHLER